eukprot:1145394-Pelagomonas_calceolata.AAC.5
MRAPSALLASFNAKTNVTGKALFRHVLVQKGHKHGLRACQRLHAHIIARGVFSCLLLPINPPAVTLQPAHPHAHALMHTLSWRLASASCSTRPASLSASSKCCRPACFNRCTSSRSAASLAVNDDASTPRTRAASVMSACMHVYVHILTTRTHACAPDRCKAMQHGTCALKAQVRQFQAAAMQHRMCAPKASWSRSTYLGMMMRSDVLAGRLVS